MANKINSPFSQINDLSKFLEPLNATWFVLGGWAIDIHLNRKTRERCDLDISVSSTDRLDAIEFFLEKTWQIEGKLLGGFKTIHNLSGYDELIHYFWAFPKGAEFISEYVDEDGNRRLTYHRKSQRELDYIEVFFDRIEDEYFIYRREPRLKMHIDQAIMQRDGVRYLAPELVLLFKSNALTEKNFQDFDVVIRSLDGKTKYWLVRSLSLLYGNSHKWLQHLD